MGNKGSQNNEGEADKSCRPQETGRITMPAECADQLGNRMNKKREEKNMERHHSVVNATLDPYARVQGPQDHRLHRGGWGDFWLKGLHWILKCIIFLFYFIEDCVPKQIYSVLW